VPDGNSGTKISFALASGSDSFAGVVLFRKQILIQNAEAYANQQIAEFIEQSGH